MRAAIHLRALGPVPAVVLSGIRHALRRSYDVAVTVGPPLALPRAGYRPRRAQYRADIVLDRVDRVVGSGDPGVVGVTMADIFVPDFNFLFGLSYLGRRSALVSVARLGPKRVTSTPITPQSRLVRRASKIAIHELGHGLGLDHCREPGCVMRYSDSVAELDRESSEFGPRCRERLARLQVLPHRAPAARGPPTPPRRPRGAGVPAPRTARRL